MKYVTTFLVAAIIITLPVTVLAWHSTANKPKHNEHQHDTSPPVYSPPVSTPPVSTPPPPPVAAGGQIIITNAYTTAYGWPDNTPAGAVTTIMGVNGTAGGTGTFASPITMATGFSLAGGKETDDYAAGTKFYDPNLRKYFVIGDTCGDGNSPQTESCHLSEIKGTVQLDMWVNGKGGNTQAVLNCEDSITRVGTLIENPTPNYAVVSGSIFQNGQCATQSGDTPITQ